MTRSRPHRRPKVVERDRAEQDDGPRVAPQVEGPFDDARARIAELYREARDAEERDYDSAVAEHERSRPTEYREAVHHQPHQPQHQQQQVKLVVDGREQMLPMDEVIRRAQLATATEHRLDEAKKVLLAAKQARTDRPADDDFDNHDRDYDSDRREEPRRAQNPVDAQLRSVVEAIQVGDLDEGTQAMQELAPVLARQIHNQLVTASDEQRMKQAVDQFQERFPDLATDNDLGLAGMSVLRRTLVNELRAAGIQDADRLGHLPTTQEVKLLAHAAAEARRRGRPVRDFDAILERAGHELSRKFNIRPSSGGSRIRSDNGARSRIATEAELQARYDRKRAMPSQPRSAGIRADYSAPSTPRPRTAAEIVADTRRSRGFPTDR
jgi:hypothetical protein